MNAAHDPLPAAGDAATQQLAAGFAAHLRRWALALGAAPDAADAAALAGQQLSAAVSAGHVCLLLDALPKRSPAAPTLPADASAWRAALLAARVTGTPAETGAMPLTLDGDGRLYLQRYFDFERRLAARLRRAACAPPLPIDGAAAAMLARCFPVATHAAGPDWQQLAVALALRQRLLLISGGPGTGKTTTVVQLLACLLAQDPGCRIVLAAPTGKAAARMTEALQARAGTLPDELRMRLPVDAFTVHRLLGVTPTGFTHHAGRLLPLDVLVVDEASMLDLALATRLFEAVPDSARIVLLGDKDQLAAVESGAVFAELSADPGLSDSGKAALGAACGLDPATIEPPAPLQRGAWQDSTVWLQQNYRFAAGSGIGALASAVQRGDRSALFAALRPAGAAAAVQWIEHDGDTGTDTDTDTDTDDSDRQGAAADTLGGLGTACRRALLDGYAAYFDSLQRQPQDAAAAFAAFAQFRVLCAHRAGARGVDAVNRWLQGRLQARLQGRWPAAIGRPLLVQRNDPQAGLFNGDIGLTLPDAAGHAVAVFPAAGGGLRQVPLLQLPQHETAFAMTVHKAQGSEFDAVLLLLPMRPSRVLSRELLYTGATRARERLTLAGPAAVLAAALASPLRRASGLLARLHES